jgi:hypothetical protein
MTSEHRPDDQRLRDLLDDAVADVEPHDRLHEIRRRTRDRTRARQRWLPVVAGAGLATALVVVGTVVALEVGDDGPPPDEPPPAASRPAVDPATRATPVYFLGETATGPRLYREFQRLPDGAGEERVATALDRLEASAGAADPDYETFWPDDSFVDVSVGGETVTVDVASQALPAPEARPERDRRLALQQVVFTAEAVLGDDVPVAFEHDGAPATEVLGVPVSGPVARDRQYDAVAPVNISDPVERLTVAEGEPWTARGTASDYVREVAWTVTDAADAVVARGTAEVTADGTGTPEFPGWSTAVEADLAPGSYVFEARVTGIGEASDTPATYTDTRTVVVR